jgi:hypothetical protein
MKNKKKQKREIEKEMIEVAKNSQRSWLNYSERDVSYKSS